MKNRIVTRWADGLWKDCQGAAAMEFAMVAPIFILLIIGTLQLGLAYYANAGLRNAVEMGARYAVIYPNPSDTQITAKVRANTFGMESSRINDPTLTRGTSNGVTYVNIAMSYDFPLKFILIPSDSVNLRYSRRAYFN